MAVGEVVVSSLEVIIDLDVVYDHTLIFDFLALGVKEGVADALKLGDIVIFNNLAYLHGGSDLGEEQAELFDAVFNHALVVMPPAVWAIVLVLVAIAMLKVSYNLVDLGYEGADIPNACLNVDLLRLKSAFDNTVNKLVHVVRIHANRFTWDAPNASWIKR